MDTVQAEPVVQPVQASPADAQEIKESQDPLYTRFKGTKLYDAFNPGSKYGQVYMEKARGRVLFAISEMNTTRKLLNFATGATYYESSGDQADPAVLRGVAYKEALMEILSLDDAALGNYSVTGNALTDNMVTRGVSGVARGIGNFFTRRGGRRGKRHNRKTHKKGKKH
jgi:hypothetical protein